MPELTGNRLMVRRGQMVTLMETNLNSTHTGIAGRTYTVSAVSHGFFAHRDAPSTPIRSFTQAEVNGGVIRFVHDNCVNAPAYSAQVSDGTTTTLPAPAIVCFDLGT